MLTGALVRVRFVRDAIIPRYIDAACPEHLAAAEVLLDLFNAHVGETRGELNSELDEVFGDDPGLFVVRGLMKLLEDRCEFAVVSDRPPEVVRDAVFAASFRARSASSFARQSVIDAVATELDITSQAVEDGLFADLKAEQRLIRVAATTPGRLLERYNVALAQAVLLKAVEVRVDVRGETPARLRRLFRLVKFHRLVCEVTARAKGDWRFHLDGPLSLFTATQKYGLQLAQLLPALLSCHDFELEADLRWGPQKMPKKFRLTPKDGLVSHLPETGTYVPPEVAMFAEQFRKKCPDWDLTDETDVIPLGDTFWVPDFRLLHRPSRRAVALEILGFWRKAGAERHLARLRQFAPGPFLVAVSDSLKVDEPELESLPGLVRFRQMPLPDAVAKAALQVLDSQRVP
jgi:hypothetical protein